jgi:hypothetical protein
MSSIVFAKLGRTGKERRASSPSIESPEDHDPESHRRSDRYQQAKLNAIRAVTHPSCDIAIANPSARHPNN